jgi:hypothetical protein
LVDLACCTISKEDLRRNRSYARQNARRLLLFHIGRGVTEDNVRCFMRDHSRKLRLGLCCLDRSQVDKDSSPRQCSTYLSSPL